MASEKPSSEQILEDVNYALEMLYHINHVFPSSGQGCWCGSKCCPWVGFGSNGIEFCDKPVAAFSKHCDKHTIWETDYSD